MEVNALDKLSKYNACNYNDNYNKISFVCLIDNFILYPNSQDLASKKCKDGCYFIIIMNYLENSISLNKLLHNYIYPTRKALNNIIFIIHHLITEIYILHTNNIVHFDIKPENILVEINNKDDIINAQLIDFGSSCVTYNCKASGTLKYMAPEILRLIGSPEPIINREDAKYQDIWALGILFYRLLNNGDFPFTNNINKFNPLLHELVKFYSTHTFNSSYYITNDDSKKDKNVTQSLNKMVNEMLSKNKEDRPTITELKKIINKII
jgi:serine/threonine protein kinase